MSDTEKDLTEEPTMDVPPEESGYERRDVNLLIITVLAVTCVLLVVGFAIGLNDYFLFTKDRIYFDQVASQRSPEVVELEKEQQRLLTSFGVVDEEQGIYRIPIDRAMDLLVEEHNAQK